METELNSMESLLERAEQYGKTTVELIKLKSLDKAADVSSVLISRLLLIAVILVFVITLNMGAAFWLGSLLGKDYYGFFAVAAFYGVTSVILYFIHPKIKARINNVMVSEMIN